MNFTAKYRKVVSKVLMMTISTRIDSIIKQPFHKSSLGVGYVSCAGSFLASCQNSPVPSMLRTKSGIQELQHFRTCKDNWLVEVIHCMQQIAAMTGLLWRLRSLIRQRGLLQRCFA